MMERLQNSIRHSGSLCAGEQEYVAKRKQIVLKSLDISTTTDNVPHIALLGSGGGQRSAMAFMGTLHQMEAEHLLDTLLYIGGVSGSTWTMSFLYSDPEWSTNMSAAVTRLLTSEVTLNQTLEWLGQKAEKEDFSLTDVWGALTSTLIMKKLDERRLSDEADRNASNPYPIYCAIERQCFDSGLIDGQWFEVTPHEAGFPEIGYFVETSVLGSKFQSGELLQRGTEMDMVELQGVFSSALADMKTNTKTIVSWLKELVEKMDVTAKEYLQVLKKKLLYLLNLILRGFMDPSAVSDMDILWTTPHDKGQRTESELWTSMSVEDRQLQAQQWGTQLLEEAEVWSESLEDGPLKTQVTLIFKIFKLILKLEWDILKWEWGTKANFLHQHKDPIVPDSLKSMENLHLIDAGLLINTPYPSFLGKKRDIDLIIAAESSAGNMFEPLTLTRNYAVATKKPFPAIDDKILEDRDFPKDCYVFEGKDQEPTIVCLPLFNRRNCKDPADFKARMDEFSTFQFPYNEEKINFLLETAKANIQNNKETLLQEINKAALRKQSRKKVVSH